MEILLWSLLDFTVFLTTTTLWLWQWQYGPFRTDTHSYFMLHLIRTRGTFLSVSVSVCVCRVGPDLCSSCVFLPVQWWHCQIIIEKLFANDEVSFLPVRPLNFDEREPKGVRFIIRNGNATIIIYWFRCVWWRMAWALLHWTMCQPASQPSSIERRLIVCAIPNATTLKQWNEFDMAWIDIRG